MLRSIRPKQDIAALSSRTSAATAHRPRYYLPPRKQLPADVGSPETFEVIGKSRCLRRPAESPRIGGANEAVGRHPQTTGFAVLEDDIFHGQADRTAAEAEGGADHLGDFLERVVAVLCKEEGPSRSLLHHEKVEVDEIVDVDVRVAIEPLPEVDTRTDLPGQCDQLRDLVAVVLQAAPGP